MIVLTGRYEHTLDPKNRLFIPSKLRDKLGDSFTMCKAPSNKPCLYLYPNVQWEKICERVFNLEMTAHNQELQSRLFENVQADCKPDSQGRLTIASDLVEYASLEHDVVIIGAGPRAEIWDSEELRKFRSMPIPEQIENEENYGVAF